MKGGKQFKCVYMCLCVCGGGVCVCVSKREFMYLKHSMNIHMQSCIYTECCIAYYAYTHLLIPSHHCCTPNVSDQEQMAVMVMMIRLYLHWKILRRPNPCLWGLLLKKLSNKWVIYWNNESSDGEGEVRRPPTLSCIRGGGIGIKSQRLYARCLKGFDKRRRLVDFSSSSCWCL